MFAIIAAGTTLGAIDRPVVVARHTTRFSHTAPIDAGSTAWNALTVGNGDFAFTADLTGLQSLNNSYSTPHAYPLYTLSNWGWHTPDPSVVYGEAPGGLFHADGSLNYVAENVSIADSADARRGKGNRTVPYQFNCQVYNAGGKCDFLRDFPARLNLGQLAFVLPGAAAAATAGGGGGGGGGGGARGGCDPLGAWCNTAAATLNHSTGRYGCEAGRRAIDVVPASAAAAKASGCAANASCSWAGGWHGAPFCADSATGEIAMDGVTGDPPRTNRGYFRGGSCDAIQWNNTFDRSAWCRSGSAACAPAPPPSPGDAAGDFHFLALPNVSTADQALDMWTGELSSNWSYVGRDSAVHNVSVLTTVAADTDTVATRFTAPSAMGLGVQLAFPTISRGGYSTDWQPFVANGTSGPWEDHLTTVLGNSRAADGRSGRLDLHRTLQHDRYSVSCAWALESSGGGSGGGGGGGGAAAEVVQTAPHAFTLHLVPAAARSGAAATRQGSSGGVEELSVVELRCRFESACCVGTAPPKPAGALAAEPVPSFAAARGESTAMWDGFWRGGAFADIAGRTPDPRAHELERRVVQGAFLLRSQESGSVPPQESALLYNSWTGKHHTEMRYWHQAWLPLWGHPELLARSDEWFVQRLGQARRHAAEQGYAGARWGKMLGESNPHGLGAGERALMYWESPNNINPGLVWHQPHVVYMAELEYRAAASGAAQAEVLHRLADVVLNTTAFIADFPERRLSTGTRGAWLDLGPPLVSAAEGEGPYDVFNPTYEITQFRFALEVGQAWRERLGMARDAAWDSVRENLAPLPVVTLPDGVTQVYNRHQNCAPSVFDPHAQHCQALRSHPALTGALGCMPQLASDKAEQVVDPAIMNNTLFEVLATWDWNGAWGWDMPMVAMTAVRLNQPEVAVDTLLMNTSKNNYVPTGYNHPGKQGELTAYLPGNGGIMIAIALMAGGWEGAPPGEAPGFPSDWAVQAEGFTPYF
jgi:hypothetical protein